MLLAVEYLMIPGEWERPRARPGVGNSPEQADVRPVVVRANGTGSAAVPRVVSAVTSTSPEQPYWVRVSLVVGGLLASMWFTMWATS